MPAAKSMPNHAAVECSGSSPSPPSRTSAWSSYGVVLAVTIAADSDAPPPVMGALTAKFSHGAVDHRHIAAPLGHNRWARDRAVPQLVTEWLHEL